MKKLGLFALAFALVLGMSQCKKENTTTSNDEGSKVPITLNVNGDGGSRVAVEGSTGVVTFEDGDVLHVVSNGAYVGTLAYNGTQFSGEITEPTEGQKLQFYFLGNKTPVFDSDNMGCFVVIDDQTEYLPVISYAPSQENYQVGLTAYNATLLNKCALVKFNVTTISEAATRITGMNNKVTVDFATNGFTYSQEGAGSIALPAGNGDRWAILLPQEEVAAAVVNSYDEYYAGICGTIPAIAANDYLTDGITATIDHRAGVINGLFSVSATHQVRFSKGNLQYIGSAGNGDDNNTGAYWKFADHQWDYFGTTTGQNSDSKTVDRDLFGWGTSGCYSFNMPPWSTSTTDSDYYVYGSLYYSLYNSDGTADWGYNAISNGGNTVNSGWRTLTDYEWPYVFNRRSTTSGIRWAKGTVNGVNGVILLPDDWSPSIYALNDTNGGDYPSNTITAEDWINVLEANGAVFLPAADSRVGTTVHGDMGLGGQYWSSSRYERDLARCLMFFRFALEAEYAFNLHRGLAVRLVLDVE